MLGLRLVAGGFSRIVFFDIFGEAETTGEIAVQIYAGTVFLPFFSRSILADRNTVRIYHWKKNDADITPKIPVAGSVRQFAVVVTRQIIGEHIQKNLFDMERYMKRHPKVKPTDAFEVYEVNL
mgnify:CR=1 FL=1